MARRQKRGNEALCSPIYSKCNNNNLTIPQPLQSRSSTGPLQISQYIVYLANRLQSHAISCLISSAASAVIVHKHLFLAVNDNLFSLNARTALAGWSQAGEGGDDVELLQLGAQFETAVDN